MKIKKIILLLITLWCIQPLVFSYNENEEGYPASHGDDDEERERKNAEFNRKADDLENKVSEQESNSRTEEVPDDLTQEAAEVTAETEEAQTEITEFREEVQTITIQNIVESQDQESTENSPEDGDPVRITQGTYEQKDTDLTIGNNLVFEVKRLYSSENKITASFGYGWSSNLDERILYGVQVKPYETEQALIEYANTLKANADEFERQIVSAYHVSSIQTAHSEHKARIERCQTIQSKASSLYSSLSSLESEASGYPAASRISSIKGRASSLKSSISSKISELEQSTSKLSSDLMLLQRIRLKYDQAMQELAIHQQKMRETEKRKNLNKYTRFTGTPVFYEETDLNTITYIDEDAFPHLLYETSEQSSVWKNQAVKKITRIIKQGSGLKLELADGTTKLFDSNGFLTQITDRNGNFIKLVRNQDGKLKSIQTSTGEQFNIQYSGNFISSITNSRDSNQTVKYNYSSGRLTKITDTDGDTVLLEYNSRGRMTALKKCDGSSISFIYGQINSNGNYLTTQTTNEEGYSEYFTYDINARKTVYTDHDQNQTVYYFDNKHRIIKEVHPDNSVITNKYDGQDNLIQTSQNGSVTNYTYDTKGNITRTSYSDGSYESFNYNNYNQLVYYCDRDGITYEYIYDTKGNLTQYYKGGKLVYEREFDSRGNVTKRTVFGGKEIKTIYEYDSFSNLISEQTAGIKTIYEYDNQNRIIKVTQAGIELYTIAWNGKTIIKTDFNGLQTTYHINGRKDITQIIQKDLITGTIHTTRIEYDKRHLPLKVYTGDGSTEALTKEYQYTPEGHLKKEILAGTESYIKTYEYDKGQICRITQSVSSGGPAYSYEYKFQNKQNNEKMATIKNPLGFTVMFEFDAWGNLKNQTDENGQITQNIWSHQGRLKKSQNSYGGFYEYEYDSSGNLIKSGEENSAPISATWYPDGSIKTATDSYGNTTEYSYDNKGNLICEKSIQGTSWYEYDNFSRMTKQTIGNTNDEATAIYFCTIDYSSDSRTVTITEGGKYKTTYEIDAFNNIIRQTDGNGNSKRFEYNSSNQLVKAYDSYNNATVYEYNALGKIKSETLPEGEKTVYEYNALGQTVKVSDDFGILYSAEYDAAGRLIKEKERGDIEKTYEHDKTGRITKVLYGGQTVQAYTYEQRGTQLTVTDGNGEKYLYNYNSFGRLLSEKNRLNLVQTYSYDQAANIKQQKSFDNSTTTISYSDNQLIQTVTYSDGSQNRFVFDAAGNIIQAQNEYAKTEYKYDKGGRLILQKEITTGEEIHFEYDTAGNRIRLLSSNRETRYTYGANNEIKEFFDNKQRVSVQLAYNKNGREILRTFGNGTSEHTRYDKAGNITLKYQKNSQGEIIWGEGYVYSSDGKRSATINTNAQITLYEYDKQGRIAAIYYPYTKEHEELLQKEAQANGITANKDAAINRYLSLDEKSALVSRLNEMHYSLGASVSTMQLFIKEAYTYDKNGNRITKQTPYGTIEYSYDKENRLTSSGSHSQAFTKYTYDNAGNLLSQESQLNSTQYAYNAQNRLIYCEVKDKSELTFTRTKYAYDAFGRRLLVQDFEEPVLRTVYDGFSLAAIKQSPVYKNGTFTDTYETGIRRTQENNPTGDRYRFISDQDSTDSSRYFYLDDNAYKQVSNRYKNERTLFSLNGEISAQVSQEAGTEYFATDILGSIRTVSDTSGNSRQEISYDAFGSLVQGNLSSTTDFGYLGKQQDPSTRLYNYGYRDYNPATARFTTLDPIRDGPNWFTYCNSDPVNFVDLWGLAPRNMSEEDREAYINKISEYTDYVNNKNEMGISDDYDCADTTTYLYSKATAATSFGDLSGKLTHNGNPIGTNIRDIHSSDFFSSQTTNITFYSEKSFNNSNVEVGTILVWQGPGADGGKGWVGHSATVVDVSRDDEGNVTNIKIIQGHSGGDRTEVVDIPNQADLDSYAGTFVGFGELGENSTTPFKKENK